MSHPGSLEKQSKTYQNLLHYSIVTTLFVGAVLRVVVCLQNRSLFIDEANLARNFAEKSLAQFFQTLDYEQYSPPLFSLIEKCSIHLYGVNEYALRLVPLLSSLLVLFLFYRLSRHFIKNKFILLFAIFILSFSNIFLEYATTVKQYMSDTMVALALAWWAINQHKNNFSWQDTLKWASVGGIIIWWSMTSVFVLSGIGIYFLWLFFEKRDRESIFKILASIVVWLISFGIYYFSILKKDVGSDYLNTFHQAFFLPLLSTSAADWSQVLAIFRSIFRTTVGYTTLAYVVGIIGILAGLVFSIKNRKEESLLLLLPIIVCLAASTLKLYSLMPRLTLFFIPFLLIMVGLGWQEIYKRIPLWGKVIVVVLCFATASLHDSYQFFIKKYEIEEIQSIMKYVQSHQQADDAIFVYLEAVPAFQFYRNNHQNKAQYDFKNVILGDYTIYPTEETFRQNEKRPQRVWLIYSHIISEVSRQRMAQDLAKIRTYAREIDKIEETGAYGFLFEW